MEMKFVTNAETLTAPVQQRGFLDLYHLPFQVPMDSGCSLPSNALVGGGHDNKCMALRPPRGLRGARILPPEKEGSPFCNAIKPGGTPSLPLKACHARSRMETASPANLLLSFQRKLTQFAFENFAIGIAR